MVLFQTVVTEEVKALRQQMQPTDISIIVGDKQIHAHRNILKARSFYFSRYRVLEPVNHQSFQTVELSSVTTDIKAVESVINFCYTGEINITTGNLEAILKLSSFLSIFLLRNVCSQFMLDNHDLDNCLKFYTLAIDHNFPWVKKKLALTVKSRFHDCLIFKESSLETSPNQLRNLVKGGILKHCSIETLMPFAMAWIRQGATEKHESFGCVILYIACARSSTGKAISRENVVLLESIKAEVETYSTTSVLRKLYNKMLNKLKQPSRQTKVQATEFITELEPGDTIKGYPQSTELSKTEPQPIESVTKRPQSAVLVKNEPQLKETRSIELMEAEPQLIKSFIPQSTEVTEKEQKLPETLEPQSADSMEFERLATKTGKLQSAELIDIESQSKEAFKLQAVELMSFELQSAEVTENEPQSKKTHVAELMETEPLPIEPVKLQSAEMTENEPQSKETQPVGLMETKPQPKQTIKLQGTVLSKNESQSTEILKSQLSCGLNLSFDCGSELMSSEPQAEERAKSKPQSADLIKLEPHSAELENQSPVFGALNSITEDVVITISPRRKAAEAMIYGYCDDNRDPEHWTIKDGDAIFDICVYVPRTRSWYLLHTLSYNQAHESSFSFDTDAFVWDSIKGAIYSTPETLCCLTDGWDTLGFYSLRDFTWSKIELEETSFYSYDDELLSAESFSNFCCMVSTDQSVYILVKDDIELYNKYVSVYFTCFKLTENKTWTEVFTTEEIDIPPIAIDQRSITCTYAALSSDSKEMIIVHHRNEVQCVLVVDLKEEEQIIVDQRVDEKSIIPLDLNVHILQGKNEFFIIQADLSCEGPSKLVGCYRYKFNSQLLTPFTDVSLSLEDLTTKNPWDEYRRAYNYNLSASDKDSVWVFGGNDENGSFLTQFVLERRELVKYVHKPPPFSIISGLVPGKVNMECLTKMKPITRYMQM